MALGGWASNNKFSLMGGVRATAQMISYEIALGLIVICMIMHYQTVSIGEMVLSHQAQGIWHWGIWHRFPALLERSFQEVFANSSPLWYRPIPYSLAKRLSCPGMVKNPLLLSVCIFRQYAS